MFTLETLFNHADIDDLFQDDHVVQLSLSIRETKTRISLEGESLKAVLDEAEEMVRKDLVLESLKSEGLTDGDIERLSDSRALIDDAWQRGYSARNQELEQETLEFERELRQHQAYEAAKQELATAGVAEPITITAPALESNVALNEAISRNSAWIEEDLTRPVDAIGIPIVISMPAKIVLS